MIFLKNLLSLLTKKEKKDGVSLLAMVVLMALLDTVGIASIMPFMAMLANNNAIQTSEVYSSVYKWLGFVEPRQFILSLGILAFLMLLTSLSFKAFVTYRQLQYTLECECSLSKRLAEHYLRQPYAWFLNRHSADLGKNVLSEVSLVVNGALMPLMTVMGQGAVALALISLLLVTDPLLAITVAFFLGSSQFIIFRILGPRTSRIASDRMHANKSRFTALNEAFGAIKEIKLAGLEEIYARHFAEPAKKYAESHASAQIMAQLPRFIIEGIAFGGMMIVMLTLMSHEGGLETALPLISLYALAGYRLMPALQQIYSSCTQLRLSGPSVENLCQDFNGLVENNRIDKNQRCFYFHECVKLDNISYRYPGASSLSLENINIEIRANSVIGLIGSTGSGKTTLVDLILGLLEPQIGRLSVDGKDINNKINKKGWQHSIGYVPQHIYLSDETVAANIAFGVMEDEINIDAVIHASKVANLHDFIINDLPEGYSTKVGERGVRLSGGQKQRIGIARAIYKDPKVLVLDEATSALDNTTEQIVMESIRKFGKELTIIIIAHRLSTVRQCDTIYMLERGRVKEEGSYAELSARNVNFFSYQ